MGGGGRWQRFPCASSFWWELLFWNFVEESTPTRGDPPLIMRDFSFNWRQTQAEISSAKPRTSWYPTN